MSTKNDFTKKPDSFGYYWAKEDIDDVDQGWLLVMYEVDGFVYYGKAVFSVSDFCLWKKADFSKEISILYANKR